MAAPVVYQDVAAGAEWEDAGQLFAGKKFWVAQRVPTRNYLIGTIKANGGEIVQLEKKADYMIADHLRRECPPGSISYEFVDKSIKEGRLLDPEDHRAGPPLGVSREPGAIDRPTKGMRSAYTAEEDNILYKWVRDYERAGGKSGGNEIYKQLEAKYPRHTWQSWRDRYLKQLRDRPVSSFSALPADLPTPPADQPAGEATSEQAQLQGATKVSGPGRARDKTASKEDYSLEQLEAAFTSEDWEELYGFVVEIESTYGGEGYEKSWKAWAESRDNQTAEQWRQYYEKVVRPQWMRDPESKREQIRKKVELRHSPSSSHSKSRAVNPERGWEEPKGAAAQVVPPIKAHDLTTARRPTTPVDEQFENHEQFDEARRTEDDVAAYIFYSREKKWETWNAQPELDYNELHTVLMSRWRSLSTEGKAPYFEMNQKSKTHAMEQPTRKHIEGKILSSSTAQPVSPSRITQLHQSALKRLRGEMVDEEQIAFDEMLHPPKRQKSPLPVGHEGAKSREILGTQDQPLDISSASSSASASQLDDVADQLAEQFRTETQKSLDETHTSTQDEAAELMEDVESVQSEDCPKIDRLPAPSQGIVEISSDNLPSDTPTPRASRQNVNNCDTQAILSSPFHSFKVDKLPILTGYTQDMQETQTQTQHRSSSLAPHPESDASTTQSIEEFRRSIDNETSQPSFATLPRLLRPASSSPAPSSNDSNNSGDPDVPLAASEFSDFYTDLKAEGYQDDFITHALKRTRCRPGLAEIVLEAWGEGKPLPNQRGIWSLDDDEAVESGDGVALAKLERKHTLDGWGGITERLKFLEGYRSR